MILSFQTMAKRRKEDENRKKLLTGMLLVLFIVFVAGCGKAEKTDAAALPEVRNNGTVIQWRYPAEEEWRDLVALTELRGAAGENGKDGTDGKNGVDGRNGTDGKDGINGIDGKNGINGTNGEDGRTPEFRVNGNQLQWRYEGETIWLNLYDLSALKGADGKDGSCAGYFAANGRVYTWGTPLPFNVKKESGDLISYNSSSKTITLSKGHTYSMVFSGTVMISANGNYKLCGASLIDGYNSSEMMLETRTYVSMIDDGQSARLGMSYNTIYSAEEDIALTFQYTNMLFQNTNFTDSQYNITIIALD